VLVHAVLVDGEFHVPCRALFERQAAGAVRLCLVPQVLVEFYAVITDARRVSVPRLPAEALNAIRRFLAIPGMTLLPVPGDVVSRWMELTEQHPVTRSGVFDVQLVAMMQGNGVNRIYTFNAKHFTPFEGIEVLSPSAPEAGS